MPSRELIDAMLGKPSPGVVGEEENFRQMQARDPANAAQIGLMGSSQHIPAPYENAKLLLSMLPVTGNVMAARDAYDNAGQVVEASKAGDIRGQRKAAAMTGLSLLGAMSPLPWGGAARRAAEGAASRTNIFAGPMAKTANRVALMRAQEMEGQGIPRDEIWKATGWGKGVDGKWRWEIDDSGAALTGASKGKASRFTGLSHPDLEAAYGRLAPVHGLYAPGLPETGSYQSMRVPYIAAQGRNPESAKSVTLHEFQHGAQDVEGFAMGANPKQFDSRGNLTAALERAKANGGLDPVTGDFDVAIQSRLRHAVDDAYDAYRRVAGEVEARNVQARRDMTAAERRATPPWHTQDVPDEHQILRRAMTPNTPQMSVGGQTDMSGAFTREGSGAKAANDVSDVVPMRPGVDLPKASGPISDVPAYAKSRLSLGGNTALPVEKIYADYVRHAQSLGEAPAPLMAFIRAMREQDMHPARIAGANRYFATIKE